MIGVVLLIILFISCIVYLFIGAMNSLFPNIFNKSIDKITKSLGYSKSKNARYKPKDIRVSHHDIGSNSKESNKSTNNTNLLTTYNSIDIIRTRRAYIIVSIVDILRMYGNSEKLSNIL